MLQVYGTLRNAVKHASDASRSDSGAPVSVLEHVCAYKGACEHACSGTRYTLEPGRVSGATVVVYFVSTK